MVDWHSPAQIAQDAAAFSKFIHVLLGLYIWEVAVSLDFDLLFITGRRKFRWPLIFYFLNRYCLLFSLIGITVALDVTREINCQALYTFNSCTGNMAIGLASINLCVRTIAVWTQKWYIVFPLVAIILGHWSLLLHGVLVKAAWVEGVGCVITATNSTILAATFIYSMAFDFLVLFLTGWRLAFPASGRSRLVTLVFHDGLIFFIIAFLANLIATIFMELDLNPVMSIIANVPAAIASTIVACRAVRRLSNYASKGPEVFNTTTSVTFRNVTQSAARPKVPVFPAGGVHVQMETFEEPSERSSVTYDISGKPTKSGSLDLEEQGVRSENNLEHLPY